MPKSVPPSRLGARHVESVKAAIRVRALVDALQRHALGEPGAEFSATRLKAAQILLDKVLSNAPTEVSGPGGADLVVRIGAAPWIVDAVQSRGWSVSAVDVEPAAPALPAELEREAEALDTVTDDPEDARALDEALVSLDDT